MTKTLPAQDLDAAIDAYVSAVSHSLVRTVADVELDEPYTSYDPVHALWVLERYIESVSGFALGIVAASIARAARVWGEERAVVTALAARGAPEETAAVTIGRWFERDTSLVGALRPWLHSRTCALAYEIRALATAIRDATPARSTHALAAMFAHLRGDTLVAERFSFELRAGWQHVLAVLSGAAANGESPLWQEWAHRVRGDAPPAPPTYIVEIR